MTTLFSEMIYIFAQIIYYYRLYIQHKHSKKAKLSINPKVFWKLTILAALIMTVYAYLIGSIAMIISNTITIIYAITQHKYDDIK